jgi:uroporphyrinogen-III synthase
MRALVTRPHHQAARLVLGLQARGIDCLVEPMLEIAPLPWDPWEALRGKQAVLLTSPNAAEALLRAARPGGPSGLDALPPVLAVGEATARPLRRAGLTRVETAPGSNAADLLRLVQARLDPSRGPLGYLSGETVACDFAAALAPIGFAVDRTVVYAARPVARLTAGARDAIAQRSAQAALFLSARAAATFSSLLARERLEEGCRHMVGVALSPRIAEATRPLPWRALAVARRPDLDALLDALYQSLVDIVDETLGRPAAASTILGQTATASEPVSRTGVAAAAPGGGQAH